MRKRTGKVIGLVSILYTYNVCAQKYCDLVNLPQVVVTDFLFKYVVVAAAVVVVMKKSQQF